MVPRVLVVARRVEALEVEGLAVEQVVAPDGCAALHMLNAEPVDALVVDTTLAPLDGWFVLAAAGARPRGPRILARVDGAEAARRALELGADLCLRAGTDVHARALTSRTKEDSCPRSRATSSPAPTTSGVRV